jgi:protein-disulfide isomerase
MKKIILLFVYAFSSGYAFSQNLNNEDMNASELTVYRQIIETEYCYKGCNDTVAKCLEKPDGKKYAVRIASMISRLVKAGKKPEEIRNAIKDRAKSLMTMKTVNFDLSGVPCFGGKEGVKPEITIVEFGDFQCPQCAVLAPDLHKLADEFRGKIQICFRHFVLKTHPDAVNASTASVAAQKQGRFWEYYFILFKNRDNLEMDSLKKYAQQIGLDMQKFEKDIKESIILETLRKDKTEGLNLGIIATPALFMNGKRYFGIKTYSELKDFIGEMMEQ